MNTATATEITQNATLPPLLEEQGKQDLKAGTMLRTVPDARVQEQKPKGKTAYFDKYLRDKKIARYSKTTAQKRMDAKDEEKSKNAQQKSLDWSYTANHALWCFITDAPDILIRAGVLSNSGFKKGLEKLGDFTHKNTNKWLNYKALDFEGSWLHENKDGNQFFAPPIKEVKGIRLFDGLLHDEDPSEYSSKYWIHRKLNESQGGILLREVISEVIGDAVAVPFSVMMQRAFPRFMSRLRNFGEWAQGGLFRKAARKRAVVWGMENGFDANSKQVFEKQKEIYEYEVDHLPMAYTWTISSMFFNSISSKTIGGSKASFKSHLFANVLGVTTTFLGVTALRTIFPERAAKADEWTKRNVFDPFKSSKQKEKERAAAEIMEAEFKKKIGIADDSIMLDQPTKAATETKEPSKETASNEAAKDADSKPQTPGWQLRENSSRKTKELLDQQQPTQMSFS